MPNNTNPEVKTEANPQPPPQPQIQEPPQQTDNFPNHDTILTITEGSNIDFDTKRQCCDYYIRGRSISLLSKVLVPKPNGPQCP
jgi:hypothetical protein